MALLAAEELEKTYAEGAAPVTALRGVSLSLEPGDFVALIGPSGCGKSTLLHLCGAMDRPTRRPPDHRGEVGALDDDALTRLRRDRIGFVFQFFNLLPTLTLGDNIALPCLLAGLPVAERRGTRPRTGGPGRHRRTACPLPSAGLGRRGAAGRDRPRPGAPAGPVVADEPTGNLDSANGATVLALLAELNRDLGVTILLATHAAEVAAAASRTLRLRDGRLDAA